MELKSIALIGMMGSGKTTVGGVLAGRLGWEFVDLDTAIEQVANKSVAEVFRDAGETGFRWLESDILGRLSTKPNRTVIATGGGVVETPTNRNLLKSQWQSVWLEARLDTLIQRIHADTTERPLLQSLSPDTELERLRVLYQRREPWYREVSRYRIRVDDLSITDVVSRIAVMI